MKKEIEVKAKVENFDVLLSKLKELGCVLSEPLTQNDNILLSKELEFPDIILGTPVLRIRESKDTKFTLKIASGNELVCEEHEVIVSNAENTKQLLEALGYHTVVKVNKTRRKCKYNDYEICLDEVEELGSFVEVEKFSEDDPSKIQEELFQFLESLGVKKEDQVFQGYDTLMFNKNT
jgi:adenylate cyclase, class 2